MTPSTILTETAKKTKLTLPKHHKRLSFRLTISQLATRTRLQQHSFTLSLVASLFFFFTMSDFDDAVISDNEDHTNAAAAALLNNNNNDNDNANANAAPPRPNRVPGDWTDNRTPPDEAFFPRVTGNRGTRRSAAPHATLRGAANTTVITYGNRREQATTYLNTHGPAGGFATQQLQRSQTTAVDMLVSIIDIIRYLAIAFISPMVAANANMTMRQGSGAEVRRRRCDNRGFWYFLSKALLRFHRIFQQTSTAKIQCRLSPDTFPSSS